MRSLQRIITLWMKFYFYWVWVFATHYYTMNDLLLLLVMSRCNALLHYEWRFTFYWVRGPCNTLLHYEWSYTYTGYESLQRIITIWMKFYLYWIWVFATHYYTMDDILHFTGYEVLAMHFYTMNDVLLLTGYGVLSTHYYTMNGVIVLTGCESRNLSLFEIAQKLKNLEEFFRGKMHIKNSNYEIKVIDKIVGTRVGSVSRV